MIGRFSDYQTQAWFDALMDLDWWGALIFDNPFAVDPLTVEVIGGSYERAAITKERHAFNLIRNSNLLVWRDLPAGVHIAGVAAFDASTNGNMICAGLYDSPTDLPSGGTWSLGVAEFQAGMDVTLGP